MSADSDGGNDFIFKDFLSTNTGLVGQDNVSKKLSYLVRTVSIDGLLDTEERQLLSRLVELVNAAYIELDHPESESFSSIKGSGLIGRYPEYSLLLEASATNIKRNAQVILLVLVLCKRYREITGQTAACETETPPSVVSHATLAIRLYGATAKSTELPSIITDLTAFQTTVENGKFRAVERLIRYVARKKLANTREISGVNKGIIIDSEVLEEDPDDELFTKNKTRVTPLIGDDVSDSGSYIRQGGHPNELIVNRVVSVEYESAQPKAFQRARQSVASSAVTLRNVKSALAYDRLSPFDITKLLDYINASLNHRHHRPDMKAWEFECMLALLFFTGRDHIQLTKMVAVDTKDTLVRNRGDIVYHRPTCELGLRLYNPKLSSTQYAADRIFLENALDGNSVDEKPVIWVKAPKFLRILLNKRFSNINQKGESRTKLFSAKPSVYKVAISASLRTINRKHGTSLTITRVTRYFSYALLSTSNDPAVAYLVSGLDIRCGEVSAHYLYTQGTVVGDYVHHTWLQIDDQYYRQQLTFANDFTLNEPDVGSKSNLTVGQLSLLVGHLKQKMREAVRNEEFIKAHNFYVTYIYFWLVFVTGHRPVNAPLSSREQIDFSSGFVSVSDKDDLEKTHSRIVWLTPKLLGQVKDYDQYLRHVLGGNDKVRAVTTAVGFLFLLDQRGKAKSITPSRIKELVPEWLLKSNIQRHFIRSKLIGDSFANYFMNHWIPGTEPHHRFSVVSPYAAYQSLSPKIKEIEKASGWTLQRMSEHRFTFRILIPDAPVLIGEAAREQRLRKTAKVLRHSFDKLLNEKFPEVAQNKRKVDVSEQRVNGLIDTFRREHQCNTAELRSVTSHCTQILKERHKHYGWTGYIPPSTFVQKPAENLFRSENYKRIGVIRRDLDRFQDGIFKRSATVVHRYQQERMFGELLFSCVFLGGLLDRKALRALPLYLFDVKRDDNLTWITFFDDLAPFDSVKSVPSRRRWFIDPVSLSLLSRITASFTFDISTYSAAEAFVKRAFKHYAKLVSLSVNTIDALCSDAQVFLGLYIDHAALHYSANTFDSTALPDKAFLSAIRGKCYALEAPKAEITATKRSPKFSVDNTVGVNLSESLSQFKTFRQAVRNNNQRLSNAKLLDRIDVAIEQATKKTTSSGWVLLLRWFHSLVKKSIRQSTLLRYLSAIGWPVLSTLQDNITLDDQSAVVDAFDTLQSSFSERENDKPYKLARLSQFADFARQRYDQTPYISVTGGKKQANAKAALLPDWAFVGIKAALNVGSPGSEEKFPYFIFLLAYRCGLRISEISGLLIRDIQIGEVNPESCVILVVRSNRHVPQKSNNASRKLSLHWYLTRDELKQFLGFVRFRSQKISSRKLLFSLGESGDQLVNSQRITADIQSLMREVTKQSDIVFHSLRHTFANNMFVALLALEDFAATTAPSVVAAKAIRALNEPRQTLLFSLAELLGHVSPSVSIYSYIHLFDIYLFAQLSPFGFSAKHSEFQQSVYGIDVQALVCQVLDVSPEALRKRRSRADKAPTDKACANHDHVNKHEVLLSATLTSLKDQVLTTFEPQPYSELNVEQRSFEWSYEGVVSFIAYLKRGVSPAEIKGAFDLSDEQFQRIRALAIEISNHKTIRGTPSQLRTGKNHSTPKQLDGLPPQTTFVYLLSEPKSQREKMLAKRVFNALTVKDMERLFPLVLAGFRASNKTIKFRRVDDFSDFVSILRRFHLRLELVSLSVHTSKKRQFEQWLNALKQAGLEDLHSCAPVSGAVARETCLVKVLDREGNLSDGWRYAVLQKFLATKINSIILL